MQVMNELIPVTILIADRTYRLKIHPKDEEMLRKTVKTITEQNTTTSQQMEKDNITDQLDSIERMLENQLKKEE